MHSCGHAKCPYVLHVGLELHREAPTKEKCGYHPDSPQVSPITLRRVWVSTHGELDLLVF